MGTEGNSVTPGETRRPARLWGLAINSKIKSMQFNECPDVSPQKLAELRERIKHLAIDLAEIEERFARGGGKGGQKINKTSNCVQLCSRRFNIIVRCQRERRRSLNRFLALRELVDKIELQLSPATSRLLAEQDKIRRNKSRRRQRHQKKLAAGRPVDNCESAES